MYCGLVKIVVLGGYGEMGSIVARDLVKTCKNCEIVIAGRDGKKAARYAKSFRKKNVKGVGVDVTNHDALVKVLEGANVVVNAVVYKFNLHVMKASLDAKCNYVDLGGMFHMTRKQLRLHDKFKKKGLIAVLGMGSTPGTTNVMAAYGVKILNKVREIKITFAAYDETKYKTHFVVPYSMYTVFDEFADKPAVFTNGKLKFVKPLSGEETFVFPKPIGKVKGYYTLHSELATFPSSFRKNGLKECSFRVTFDPDFIHDVKLLIEAGLASKKYVNVGGVKVRPVDVTVKEMNRLIPKNVKPKDMEYIRVELFGKKSGKDVELTLDAVAHSDAKAGISAGTLNTAVPPSIVAQMITKRQVKARGVLPPEACIDPKLFFNELSKRNIKVYKQMRSVAIG